MKRRKLFAIVAAGGTAIAVASTGVASSGIAGARAGTRGVTNDSIKVAGLAQTAQFAAPDVETGAKARFQGEKIFGRSIEYAETADDKGDANTNLAEARRLVQQGEVFAVVPVLTPVIGQAATFFAQQKVPFFGWAIAQSWCKNPYAFGFTGCIVPPPSVPNTGTTWGALIDRYYKSKGDAKGSKGKTAAVITEDNDTGKEGNVEIVAQAKVGGGMKVTYAKSAVPAPPAVVGDYSPFVTDIMTSNNGKAPDVVFITMSFPNVLGLSKALTQANFQGVQTNAVAYDPRLVTSATGQAVFTQFDLPEDAPNNPAIAKIIDRIKAVAGDKPITQPMLAAYFSADFFVAALKKTGKNLTPEALAKTVSKMTYEIKGVIGPTKFPKAQTQGAPCGTLVQSDGAKYNIVVPYACYRNINYKTGKTIKY